MSWVEQDGSSPVWTEQDESDPSWGFQALWILAAGLWDDDAYWVDGNIWRDDEFWSEQ